MDCRPLALPMLMRCPSSSTWSTGLIWSMEPTTAVVAEMRPPRLRKCRSSTVNWWQRESLLASAQSRTSSMVRPFFRSWAAYHTSSPWPREAHRVSTVYSFRSGYFSLSSSTASLEDWKVADRPEEKASTSTSRPAWSRGSMASTYWFMLTAAVVATSPARRRW